MKELLSEIKYDARGLVPAIVQDAETKEVLMMAWMNAESLRLTIESGETWFWSRSHAELWHKGATSGNIQTVVEIRVDCDVDTMLVLVNPAGPACHTGKRSCFYSSIDPKGRIFNGEQKMSIQWLFDVIEDRKNNPTEKSYTTSLFNEGLPKIAQKVGEEGTEVVVAALAQEDQRLIEEVADLTYHTLVLLAARGLTPAHIVAELEKRHK